MLSLFLAIFVCIVCLAVLHWKMERKRANRWGSIPAAGLIIVLYLTSYYSFDPLRNLAALVFFLSLAFFATDYIAYRKDKTNPAVVQDTLKGAIISHICILFTACIHLYLYLF